MKIGISGMGRIGRMLVRQLVETGHEVAAVWERLVEPSQLAYLIRYDSIHRQAGFTVEHEKGDRIIYLNGNPCRIYSGGPTASEGLRSIDILVECSGRDDMISQLRKDLPANLNGLLVSWLHPEVDQTVILGVNEDVFRRGDHRVVSLGTCTGNCFLPVLKILSDRFPVDGGIISILHPYLAAQNLMDNPHPCGDASYLRSAPMSVIPGRTRLLQSIRQVFPEFDNRFQAICFRIPSPAGLLMDTNILFRHSVEATSLIETLETAARTTHRDLITVFHDRMVSQDFIGLPWSAAIDGNGTEPGLRTIHKLLLWQDNEYGYCSRIVNFIDRFLV
ncbi:hypothetical protein JXA40_05810 [bacterium]|nr:hypothetical protein [candidate division CSSED10-310 bacterium]